MDIDMDSPPRAPPRPADDDDQDDPIVAKYRVFLKPPLPASHRLLVLQHPSRGNTNVLPDPTQVRMKPNTGMVEVDLPIDTTAGYDRNKGQHWGTLLNASVKAKAGGTHGIAGGFGIGAPPAARARANKGLAAAAEENNGFSMDWQDAVRQDKVLRTQTLGGICPADKNEARWMVGVFSGQNLHLTPATSVVSLRPALHHIDAEAEAERAKHAAAPGSESSSKDASTSRAIHMTVKSAAADGGEDVQETMTERLRAVQMEPWTCMAYVPGNYEAAFEAYGKNLVLGEKDGKGKGLDEEEDESGKMRRRNPGDATDLVDEVGKLRTAWDEDELMTAVTGLNPRAERAKKVKEEEARVKLEAETAAKLAALPKADETKNSDKMDVDAPASAPPPVVAAMPRGRGGKARGGSTRAKGTRGRGARGS